MSKLVRVIGAATSDARRAEALMADARACRTLRIDPEGALLGFELRAPRSGMHPRRDRGVRAARRNAAVS